MIDELLPCPFCDGEAEIKELNSNSFYKRKLKYRVKCQKCPCSFAFTFFETEESAAESWNTRTLKG